MRKLSAKCVPKCLNPDQKRQRCQLSEQLLEFFRRYPKDFLSRLVTMDETWLYHYDPETRQQSVEWRYSGSPRPQKIPSAQIRWKSSRLDFLGSRRHPPHWLSSKGPNYQRGVLLISAGAIEGHFEGKTPREGHQGGLVLARQCHGSRGTCSPEETGLPILAVSWSPTVFSGSCPVGLRKQLKGLHFSSDAEVIAAAETWLDGQPSEFFLSGLQKLEQRAKKCIELRREYVE